VKFLFSTAPAGAKVTGPDARSAGFATSALKPVIGACLVAAIMAGAIAWRVASRPGTPSLLPILLWQTAVWLPWIGYFYAVRLLTKRIDPLQDATFAGVAVHVLAALVVATSHLVWYWQVSDSVSPLRGLPNTKFGVYAFFFVFWFLIDLLLYLAVLVDQRRVQQASKAAAPRAQPAGEVPSARPGGEANATSSKRFVVRQGRARHVVRADDIRWVEAQGYYAALHTGSGSYLIRQSLAKLESELESERFIRVHRSTIVNVGSIAGLRTDRNGAVTVMLTDGGRRRVSRAGYKALKTRLPQPP
jgi:hypothetical protein